MDNKLTPELLEKAIGAAPEKCLDGAEFKLKEAVIDFEGFIKEHLVPGRGDLTVRNVMNSLEYAGSGLEEKVVLLYKLVGKLTAGR